MESSLLCTLSDCWTCLREGRMWSQQSISLAYSLMFFNLVTSPWSSVTRWRSASTWVHLPWCSWLTSCTGVTARYILQIDAWVTPCPHWSSIWEAASVMVGTVLREAMAFCCVETMALWQEQAELSAPSHMPFCTVCHAALWMLHHTCSGGSTPGHCSP